MDDSRDRVGEDAAPGELEQYRTLVEAAGDVMYALDEGGHITLINETPVKRLGYSKAELLGTHVSEVLPEEAVERGTALITDLLGAGERRGRFEFRATRPDGEERVYEDSLAVLTDSEGGYAGSVGVIRDITDQRRQEAELRRQNERLEEFANVVSHDLRNPLQVAQGYLREAEETGDQVAFERAKQAHERMETIIDDVLTLAREGRTVTETTPTDLNAAARTAWGTVDTGDMTLSVVGEVEVEAAPDRLRTLFENLFRNAVEHGSTSPRSHAREDSVEHSSTSNRTQSDNAVEHGSTDDAGAEDGTGHGPPTGGARPEDTAADGDAAGTVTVGPIETMHTSTRVDTDATGGFYVADDGPGIPEADRDRVFDSGFSTAPDGTGFGLAIVEEIAAAHGWAVTATESRDGGARFEFTRQPTDARL
jgi:PAS domain S-box-containing protein